MFFRINKEENEGNKIIVEIRRRKRVRRTFLRKLKKMKWEEEERIEGGRRDGRDEGLI